VAATHDGPHVHLSEANVALSKEVMFLAVALLPAGACGCLVNLVRKALRSGRIDSWGEGWAVAALFQGQAIERSENPLFFWMGVASYSLGALGCGAMTAWIVVMAIIGRIFWF
jgi:hypothetical protein